MGTDNVGVFVSVFRLGVFAVVYMGVIVSILAVVCMGVCVSKLLGISMGVFTNVAFVGKCETKTAFRVL